MLRCVLHRGNCQIGGTCIELQAAGTCILLDIGLSLNTDNDDLTPPSETTAELAAKLVSEGIFPDIAGIYRWDERPCEIDAIIVSHSHLDHWGITPWVKPTIPVYFPEAGWKLLEKSFRLLGRSAFLPANPVFFKPGKPFVIGNFAVHPHLVDHSAFGACALEITHDDKHLVYTGDFRSHGRKASLWKKLLTDVQRPVDILITEGTTLTRTDGKVQTEQELEVSAAEAMKSFKGLALIWASSSNIDRLVTAYKAAKRSNRILCVDPYTAHIMTVTAKHGKIPHPSKEYADVKVYFPSRLGSYVMNNAGESALYELIPYKVERDDIALNPERYMMLARPSVSDYLGKLPALPMLLFYSMWQGYLEEENSIKFLEFLQKHSSEFIMITLHTSGHADAQTIRTTIDSLNPQVLIPVHTTNPEWFVREYPNTRNLKNGESVEI